jgi:hypothetical protein
MNDHERRRLLEEHWERHANAGEFDSAHEIDHDDAVLEWPQSGERFVGRDTLRAMRQGAPPLEVTTWRIVGAGDLWVAENLMSVDGIPIAALPRPFDPWGRAASRRGSQDRVLGQPVEQPEPCSNSQRTSSSHLSDHHTRMRSRSTSPPQPAMSLLRGRDSPPAVCADPDRVSR